MKIVRKHSMTSQIESMVEELQKSGEPIDLFEIELTEYEASVLYDEIRLNKGIIKNKELPKAKDKVAMAIAVDNGNFLGIDVRVSYPKPDKAPHPAIYKNKIVCRGSWTLGTACGSCQRCIDTKPS